MRNTKRLLFVASSLLLTYVPAFVTLMLNWAKFSIRGPYFVSYQTIFLVMLMILLLWWLRRHDNRPLPVPSTVIYLMVAGYVAGLIAMTLYPILHPDGFHQVGLSLSFPTPDAVIAFVWFPISLLS